MTKHEAYNEYLGELSPIEICDIALDLRIIDVDDLQEQIEDKRYCSDNYEDDCKFKEIYNIKELEENEED
jgi:hypothetical protein